MDEFKEKVMDADQHGTLLALIELAKHHARLGEDTVHRHVYDAVTAEIKKDTEVHALFYRKDLLAYPTGSEAEHRVFLDMLVDEIVDVLLGKKEDFRINLRPGVERLNTSDSFKLSDIIPGTIDIVCNGGMGCEKLLIVRMYRYAFQNNYSTPT